MALNLRLGWVTADLSLSKGKINFVKKGTAVQGEHMSIDGSNNYSKAIAEILKNFPTHYKAFCDADTFTGPSVYFHNKALSLRKNNNVEPFLETVYAVLVSWGMHRMGAKGPKMVHFNTFHRSIELLWNEIEYANTFDSQNIKEDEWAYLEKIYNGIEIMSGNTHIVGRSKVMAHLLPNIIAPIDRQYTLFFLRGNKNIKIHHQWQLLKSIMVDFYYTLEKDQDLQQFSDDLIKKNNNMGWNTSRLKIIDNLVIGAVKAS